MPRAKKPETDTGPVAKPFELQWRDHVSSGEQVRVWHNMWEGDQFEVINRTDFQRLKMWCKRFQIPLVDKNEEE